MKEISKVVFDYLNGFHLETLWYYRFQEDPRTNMMKQLIHSSIFRDKCIETSKQILFRLQGSTSLNF